MAINKIQKLYLELIKASSFNEFDGEKVYVDLVENQNLWESVIMDREGFAGMDLIKLRDLSSDCNNVDTLFILVKKSKLDEFAQLTKDWGNDELSIVPSEKASNYLGTTNPKYELVRVWWD